MDVPWPLSAIDDLADRWDAVRARIAAVLFGDRVGIVLFLGVLSFAAFCWRIGILITDSYAVGNTLVNVADGHLAIRRFEYSLTLGSQPGLHRVDGRVYGRNYAAAVLALPVLWSLELLTVVFDPRLVLAAGWSLLVFVFLARVGRLCGHERPLTVAGSAVALGAFLVGAGTAHPLSDRWLPFVALQVTTLFATAFLAVTLYRLVGRVVDRRVGTLAGAAVVLASPVGFWATVPKRHVFTALAATTLAYLFVREQTAASDRVALRFRAAGYAVVALLAWLHAPEALVLLFALAPVDLLFARSNHPRRLAVIGAVFFLALTPFLVTNALISGNPLAPPRTLPDYEGGGTGTTGGAGTAVTTRPGSNPATALATTATDGSGGDAGAPGSATDAPGTPPPDGGDAPSGVVVAAIERALRALGLVWSFLLGGLAIAIDRPGRVYHTFVRSGRIPTHVAYAVNQQEAIELTLLETTPLLATLGALGLRLPRVREWAVRRTWPLRPGSVDPRRRTDCFVAVTILAFTLVYLPRLPLQTQITVRYLLPIVPLLLYGVARLRTVRTAAHASPRWLAGSYLATVGVGTAAFAVVNATLALAVGEAMQLHALVALGAGAVALVAAVGRARGWWADDRVDATLLSIPAGLTTVFLLFAALVYFPYGQFALPVTRLLASLLPTIG